MAAAITISFTTRAAAELICGAPLVVTQQESGGKGRSALPTAPSCAGRAPLLVLAAGTRCPPRPRVGSAPRATLRFDLALAGRKLRRKRRGPGGGDDGGHHSSGGGGAGSGGWDGGGGGNGWDGWNAPGEPPLPVALLLQALLWQLLCGASMLQSAWFLVQRGGVSSAPVAATARVVLQAHPLPTGGFC